MPLHDSSTHTATPISSVSIPILLDWWQRRKRVASVRSQLSTAQSAGDETYLKAYYRLMEVYSVVKSGGVQTQIEAVRAFAERESVLLYQRLSEIEAADELADAAKKQEKEKIQQEIQELRSANNWRLQALTNIAPDEEATVKQHLSDIEKTLIQVQYA